MFHPAGVFGLGIPEIVFLLLLVGVVALIVVLSTGKRTPVVPGPLPRFCPKCGKDLIQEPGGGFCPACGQLVR
jgi:hypothetical protein